MIIDYFDRRTLKPVTGMGYEVVIRSIVWGSVGKQIVPTITIDPITIGDFTVDTCYLKGNLKDKLSPNLYVGERCKVALEKYKGSRRLVIVELNDLYSGVVEKDYGSYTCGCGTSRSMKDYMVGDPICTNEYCTIRKNKFRKDASELRMISPNYIYDLLNIMRIPNYKFVPDKFRDGFDWIQLMKDSIHLESDLEFVSLITNRFKMSDRVKGLVDFYSYVFYPTYMYCMTEYYNTQFNDEEIK